MIQNEENILLFVCGFPGGGTDLVKTILNVHPDVYLNGELPFLQDIAQYGYRQNIVFRDIKSVREFHNVLVRINTWGNFENIDQDLLNFLEKEGVLTRDEILRSCLSTSNNIVWGNKTPQNMESIGILSEIFPDTRFNSRQGCS